MLELSMFERYENGTLPNQAEVESFASLGKDDREKMFRAGFLIGLHKQLNIDYCVSKEELKQVENDNK